MEISLDQIKHWVFKGGFGILDQGLYSGANFVLGILLARWLSPSKYGNFSAAYSIFLFLSIFQVALIAEPMSIFGAGKYSEQTASYLNYLLRLQWIGSFLGTFIIILLALLSVNLDLREALIAMAISLPWILFYWYLRRAFYIEMQSGMAMITSTIYSILLILIVVIIEYQSNITSVYAYLVMALSSLIASLFALRRLGVSFWGKSTVIDSLNSSTANIELWNFGKWVLPAYIAGWFTSVSFPFFISILLNSQLAGAFRAMQNIYLPFQQFLAAITLLILPWLAKQRSNFGTGKLFSLTQFVALVTVLAALIYCLFTVYYRHEIVALLYENKYYSSFDYMVIYLAIATLISSAPLVLGLALRILNHPSTILWSKGSAAFFTVLLGLPVISAFRMNGVLFILVVSTCIEASIIVFYYFRIKGSVSLHY